MGKAATRQTPPPMTVAEFLDWDDGTDTRYELLSGTAVAMAPPSLNHAQLVTALAAEIRARLRPPCRLFAQAGVRLPDRDDTFYQADLAIDCGPRAPGDRYLTEPTVLIEVLSPATAAHDRGTKASDYRGISAVREIALVSSSAVKAEIWRRTEEGWLIEDVAGSDSVLRLTSVGVEVPLKAIYEGIEFEAAEGVAEGG